MTHNKEDRLLTWISNQEEVLKKRIKQGGNTSFAEGELIALLDVKVFLLTDGKLNSPSLDANILNR